MATLIWSRRPFLDELWAAREAPTKSNAVRGCVWAKRVTSPLRWLVASMRHEPGDVSRSWAVDALLTPAEHLAIAFDASLWGSVLSCTTMEPLIFLCWQIDAQR